MITSVHGFYPIIMILSGLYITWHHLKQYFFCPENICKQFEDVFLMSAFCGSLVVLTGIIALMLGRRLADAVSYYYRTKIGLSLLLALAVSWLHILFTNPCPDPNDLTCWHYYGYPIAFFTAYDTLSSRFVVQFLSGLFANTALWFTLLTALFYKVKVIIAYRNE